MDELKKKKEIIFPAYKINQDSEDISPNPSELTANSTTSKNPFICPKCNSLSFIHFSESVPLDIYSKCTCGEEWASSIPDIVHFSEYEKIVLDLFSKHNKNLQSKKNIFDFLDQLSNYALNCYMEWTKVIYNENEVLKMFKIQTNNICQKHLRPNDQKYCNDCGVLVCEECIEKEHNGHEIHTGETILNKEHYNNAITDIDKAILNSYEFGEKGKLKKIIEKDYQEYTEKILVSEEMNEEYIHYMEYIRNQEINNHLMITFIKIILKIYELFKNEGNNNYIAVSNFLAVANVDLTFDSSFYEKDSTLEGKKFENFEQKLKYVNKILLTRNIFGFFDFEKSKKFLAERKSEKPIDLSKLKLYQEVFINKPAKPKITSIIAFRRHPIYIFATSSDDGFIRVFDDQLNSVIKIKESQTSVNYLLRINSNEFYSCNDEGFITHYQFNNDTNFVVKLFSSPYKSLKSSKEHLNKVLKVAKIQEKIQNQGKEEKKLVKICSISRDNTIKVWDANPFINNAKSLFTLSDGSTNFISVLQVNSNTILTTSEDNCVKFWDLENKQIMDDKTLYDIECFSQDSIKFINEKEILIGGRNYITIINSESLSMVCRINDDGIGFVGAAVNLNSASALICCSGHFWKLIKSFDTFKVELVNARSHNDIITGLDKIREKIFITGSYDSQVKIWKF
ncbi:MAG: hypothetical protein MJ252_13875 [archaeon]|nr:hypothetical protein [archaeon]